jgi:hypothetical protein
MLKAGLHTIAAVVFLAAVFGCEKKEDAAPPTTVEEAAPVQRQETRIIIPDEVQGKWKAVKIAVLDKETTREEVYTIDLDSEFTIPGDGLTLRVSNFLPAFIMDGLTLTSVSNEPRNPAVQIEISENGRRVFKGWLFSLYPGTHAFHHPRYSFTLVDFLPAG